MYESESGAIGKRLKQPGLEYLFFGPARVIFISAPIFVTPSVTKFSLSVAAFDEIERSRCARPHSHFPHHVARPPRTPVSYGKSALRGCTAYACVRRSAAANI
jgi:hypothetical protein